MTPHVNCIFTLLILLFVNFRKRKKSYASFTCLVQFENVSRTRGEIKINVEPLTAKYLGSRRTLKSQGETLDMTTSLVFAYTSFVPYCYLRAVQQNRAQSRLLYSNRPKMDFENEYTKDHIFELRRNICIFCKDQL